MIWDFLRGFEASAFSEWVREGNFIAEPFSTFYVLLGAHSVGMAIVVGVSWMLCARIFGFHQALSLDKARAVIRLAWWGFYLNLASGVILLAAQPRREMMTGLFWVKIAAIVLAVFVLNVLAKSLANLRVVESASGGAPIETVPIRLRVEAFVVLAAWMVAIIAGRLIGYTQPPPPL